MPWASDAKSGNSPIGGQTPMTPPVPAMTRAWSGVDAPAPSRRGARERGVGQHQRLGRHGRRPLDQIIGAVGDIDDDAALVAALDHGRAEIGEAAMNRRLGLDIAQLVHPIMR